MPKIMAAILIKNYEDGVHKFSELLNWLELSNPLAFDQSLGHKFYEYKLKNFLMASTKNRPPYDYKSKASYLLENAELVLSNVTYRPINGDLLISMGIKID